MARLVFALLCLAIIAAFVAPTLVDMLTVKTELERKVSQLVEGKVTWDSMEVRLLPRPRALIRGLSVEIPGTLSARVEQVDARLHLLPFLSGHARVKSLAWVRPVIRIDVPAASSTANAPAIDPIASYRAGLAPVMQWLQTLSVDTVIESTGEGSIEVRVPNMPSFELRKLAVHLRTATDGVELQLQTTSDFWDSLRLAGHVTFADLAARLSIEAAAVKPQPWLDYALSDAAAMLRIPSSDLHAEVHTDGRTSLECKFQLAAPALEMGRAEQRLRLADSSAKGSALVRAQDAEIVLDAVQLGTLVHAGQAKLSMRYDGQKPALSAQIPRLDVVAVRDAVDAFAGDNAVVHSYLVRIQGGEIADTQLHASAQSWSELFDVNRLNASATVASGVMIVPVIEQPATELAGRVELADGEFEVTHAQTKIGQSRLQDTTVRYSLGEGTTSLSIGFDLDLPQALKVAAQLLPKDQAAILKNVQSASGRLQGRTSMRFGADPWSATVDITRADATAQLQQLPWPLVLQAGRVAFSSTQINLSGVRGTVGKSTFADIDAYLTLGSQTRIKAASGHAQVLLNEFYPWVRSHAEFADVLQDISVISGSAHIAVNRLSGIVARASLPDYELTVNPEHVSAEIKSLPGLLSLDGGAFTVDPRNIKFDRVAAAMLDARAVVSGSIEKYRLKSWQVTAADSDGIVGADFMHWIWQRAGAPPHLELKAPMRVNVQQARWNPDQQLDVQASMAFNSGPSAVLNLAWQPELLDIRSLAVKDRISDAVIGVRLKRRLLKTDFSGKLFMHSVDAMLKQPNQLSGHATGELHTYVDLDIPELTKAKGNLEVDAVDLSWLLRKPVKVDRIDVTADGLTVRIRDAMLTWAEQTATIKGEVQLTKHGPVVDAQFDSHGLVIDKMWPASDAPAAARPQPESADKQRFLPELWPLPVTGRIKVNSRFIDFRQYHIEPATATLTLERDRARLEVHDAKLCGVSFPMIADVLPEGFAISAHLRAQQQDVEYSARCLSDERLLITGTFDMRADLYTFGTEDQLLQNLKGDFDFESRDGKIRKFGLLGNILAFSDVTGLFQHGVPKLGGQGFRYRSLEVEGEYQAGRFIVKDLHFDSSAVGLAATGYVELGTRQCQLTVLVAPFSMFTNFMRKVPIIGYVLGGAFSSVPVSVSGDFSDPRVVPLGPQAVGSELAGIFTRAFNLPGKLFAPKSTKPRDDTQPAQQ